MGQRSAMHFPVLETKSRAAAPKVETKILGFAEIKSLDDVHGTFDGYLAAFNNEDGNGDIIERGAFLKTLTEAKAVQGKNGATFLYPLLWMHDENNPIGGFTDMKEDSTGLYVKGLCDLDTEVGRRAFSAMTKGYMRQLSIGFQTVKATRDAKGVRHLTEIRLWEGSLITTGYAANQQANILATKRRGTRGGAVRTAASGKSSWPLSDRNKQWDSAGAHERLVAWATDTDGKLDESKMQSVHFWYDAAAPHKVDSYKLAFCDVVEGNVVAVPRGVFAIAGMLQGARKKPNIPAQDIKSVRDKVSTYYGRMAKKFEDEELIAPWDQDKVAWRKAIEQKAWGGILTVTRTLGSMDYLSDDIESIMQMLGAACGMSWTDGDEEPLDPGEPDPAVSILLDNMDGLQPGLQDMAQAFFAFDVALDNVLGMLGMDTDGTMGYMRAETVLEAKAGRKLSAANKAKLGAIHDTVGSVQKQLRNFIDEKDDNDDSDSSGKRAGDGVERKRAEPETKGATTQSGEEPDQESTLLAGLEELATKMTLDTFKLD
jgi:HK97 family phage prohead protease